MNPKIGTKVKLTRAWAEWHLEHPEAFYSFEKGEVPPEREAQFAQVMQLAMLVVLGDSPIGRIVAPANCGCVFASFGKHGIDIYDPTTDFMPATFVELDIEIANKSRKVLEKISKSSGVSIDKVVAVLLATAAHDKL